MRVRLDEYQGQAVICCRAWYADKDGNMRPGRGGLTVGVKHLPQLAMALDDALKAAMACGLLEGNKP